MRRRLEILMLRRFRVSESLEAWATASAPLLRRRREFQRHAIHAVAKAGGLRTIFEDMAQMPAAARAVDFRA
jgi:hypothetical protein